MVYPLLRDDFFFRGFNTGRLTVEGWAQATLIQLLRGWVEMGPNKITKNFIGRSPSLSSRVVNVINILSWQTIFFISRMKIAKRLFHLFWAAKTASFSKSEASRAIDTIWRGLLSRIQQSIVQHMECYFHSLVIRSLNWVQEFSISRLYHPRTISWLGLIVSRQRIKWSSSETKFCLKKAYSPVP